MDYNKVDAILDASYSGDNDAWDNASGRRNKGVIKKLNRSTRTLVNPKRRTAPAPVQVARVTPQKPKPTVRPVAPKAPIRVEPQAPIPQDEPIETQIPVEVSEELDNYPAVEVEEGAESQEEDSEYFGFGGDYFDHATGKKKFNIKGIVGKAKSFIQGGAALASGASKAKAAAAEAKAAEDKKAADATDRVGGISKPIVFSLVAVVAIVVIIIIYKRSN